MSSPWSCGSDPNSIWNSNSPNLNLLRRYSLRSPACTSGGATNDSNNNALSTTTVTTTNHHRHLSCGPQTLLSSSSGSPSASVAAGAGGGGVVVIGSSGSIHIQSTATTLPPAATVASAVGHTQLTNSSKSKCSWEPSADNKYLIGYIVVSRQDLEVYHSSLGIRVCGGKPTHDGQFGAIVEHVVPGSLMNIVCKLKVGDEIVEWNGHDLRNKPKEEVKQVIESTTKTAAINCFLGSNSNHSGSGIGGNCASNIIGNHQQPLSLNSSTQLRLVAVRLVNNNNGGAGNSSNNNNNTGNSNNCNGSGNSNNYNNTNNNNSSGGNNNSGSAS